MKILLAVDGSECSMIAVDEVARLPWPKDSVLKVLSIAEMPTPVLAGPVPLAGDYYAEWEKALEDQAVANTTKALARYFESGGRQIEVVAKSSKGDPKEGLLDEAAKWEADLIVVGTHGYNAFERLWLGSVSRTIASHAKCSVLIARRGKKQREEKKSGMKILLAVDGSEGANYAISEVAGRPWPAGAEIRVISAIHLPFVPTPETWSLPESYYSQVEKAGREHARNALDAALGRLRESNTDRETPLTLTSDAIVGHAEEVIIRTAREWDADLIVLGSHSYRPLERFLLGSVSHAVASHAPCSVEIVRPPLKR